MRGRGFNFLNRVFQPLRVLTARKLLLEKISILLVTFGLARPEAWPQLDWGARATRIVVLVCQGHPRAANKDNDLETQNYCSSLHDNTPP